MKLTAADRDAGANADLLFLFSSSTSAFQTLFSINPKLGEISLARDPSPADMGTYQLHIIVSYLCL